MLLAKPVPLPAARPPVRVGAVQARSLLKASVAARASSDDEASVDSTRGMLAMSQMGRRESLLALTALGALISQEAMPSPASAIQGLTAGRIPGLASTADSDGFFLYSRPEGKSGGHGVGWSEIPRYTFKVPAGWSEIPVSIADLGGTEIDLRYTSKDQGELAVVVAPVLRFADIGFNASVRIEDLGDPKRIIQGFGPELFGKPVDDEDIISSSIVKHGDLSYYQFNVKPHNLVSATAVGNRMFIISLRSNARQWKKHSEDLFKIQESFDVPIAKKA